MKVTAVQQARKPQGVCGRCRTPIEIGQAYRWWKFRYGGRQVRCMAQGCYPRDSELTQNEVLSEAYAISEEGPGRVESYDDFKDQVEDYESRIREVGELAQEKMDNIESGFGHTEVEAYANLEEQQGALESWADQVASVLDDVDEEAFDADTAMESLTQALGECPL